MNILYIKIPKTGSTTINSHFYKFFIDRNKKKQDKELLVTKYIIREYGVKNFNPIYNNFLVIHDNDILEHIFNNYREYFDNSIIICSIRNPLERFLSGAKHIFGKTIDVHKLIKNLPKQNHIYKNYLHITKSIDDFLIISNTKVKVDYWISQENLYDDIKLLFLKLNKNYVMPEDFRLMVGSIKKFDLSNKFIKLHEKIYKNDYDYFKNYKKNNEDFLNRTDIKIDISKFKTLSQIREIMS